LFQQLARAHFRSRRYALEGDAIALDRLRDLLSTLEARSVPPLVERIRERFPEAEPPYEMVFDNYLDAPRQREDTLRSRTDEGGNAVASAVFNGKEDVRYDARNAQADIYRTSWVSKETLLDFAYRPGSSRATSGAEQTKWLFGPRTYPGGVTLASAMVELHVSGDKVRWVFVRYLDAVGLGVPIPPETFLCAVPAGTVIHDYRSDDSAPGADPAMRGRAAYRGVVSGPVTDVVAYAEKVAATLRRPDPPRIKEGDTSPALQPAAWLDQNGEAAPPDLKGKIVLIDFWGITCGPCVAQLPEVREAVRHFAGTDLVIVGLHERSGTVAEVAEFARKRGLAYPLAIDRDDPKTRGFGPTFADYGIHAIPSAVVLDRAGHVVYVGTFERALARAAALVGNAPK
jgi:peroxiredoxin